MPQSIESLLPPLKPESLRCIYRLQRYRLPKEKRRYPKRRSAAVAVILFVGRLGDLYVLLSTRAGDMRTYAHDTALPGGKYEEGDVDAEGTARREAYEEIGLPMDREKVKKLCELEKFITGNSLIVTPVILLITDHTLTPLLNPSEVHRLFSMPLSAFLHSRPSQIPSFHYRISHRISSIPHWVIDSIPPPPIVGYSIDDGEVGGKEGRFYGYRDIAWNGHGTVRMHRFLTGREGEGVRPVYGLTAAILIQSATIGYDHPPDFPITAPGQKSMMERIILDVRHGEGPLRRAVDAEGLWDDWKVDDDVLKTKGRAKL
ncbi:hypothetical protein I302_100266 [Kwoniella bestiolae CBS 10118]|uniref:Nudix hydrolase domain-containing protein n=1 Tax=Kwoniella bestiolae CBS 10118 TaxID=1296100 RepID=A0A1B9G4N2_9TREE|nr:hypothetical protein I302_03638 [Kwoniella bestiolae CBS 10118]OCF25961.1 hypothetical protein I302_03638 [Kwoniella bestiolae CBS 10118]